MEQDERKIGEGNSKGNQNQNSSNTTTKKDSKQGKNQNQGRKPDFKGKSYNDVSWHYPSEAIGQAACNINYSYYPGSKSALYPANRDKTPQTVPGVMRLGFVSSVGRSVDNSSALNIAGRSLYTFTRHANAGHSNYESADEMIYILAMQESALMIQKLERAYATAFTYLRKNRQLPDVLLRAMYFDPDDVRENLAQFRFGILTLLHRFNKMCIPNTAFAFARQSAIITKVFKDSSDEKAQIYIYDLDGFRMYDPTGQEGGRLSFQSIKSEIIDHRTWIDKPGVAGYNYLKVKEWLALANRQLDAICLDEDMNIISGDILKAYGEGALYKLPELPEIVEVPIEFSEEALNCIENTTVCSAITGLDISQQTGHVRFRPRIIAADSLAYYIGNTIATHPRYFNSHKENPTWKDTLSASYGALAFDRITSGEVEVYPSAEIVLSCAVWTYGTQLDSNSNEIWCVGVFGNTEYDDLQTTFLIEKDADSPDTVGKLKLETFRVLGLYETFDWAPIIYLFAVSNIPGNDATKLPDFYGILGDLDNYTLIDNNTLKGIKDCDILGLYNISPTKA